MGCRDDGWANWNAEGAGWGGAGAGVDGTKPIWGEVVWGDGVRDGGPAGSTSGAGAGGGGGTGAASTWSCWRAWRVRRRARRVASRRYWSLEKEFGLLVAD